MTASTDPLRVTFVSSHLGAGGAERHVALLAPALRARGHDARVLCVETGGHFAAALQDQAVPLVDLGLGSQWKRHPVAATHQLRAALQQDPADVVLTNGFSAELLSRRALTRTDPPALVVWKHNIGHLGHYGLRDRWTERVPGRRVDRYLAVSHAQLDYLDHDLRIDRANTTVVHNSVRPPPEPSPAAVEALRDALGLRDAQRVWACVAALRTEKDHATLLDAFAQVHREVPGTVLLLLGDGPLRGMLEQRCASLGIADAVRFLGVRSDVEALLPLVDLLVLTSITIENFPFAVLEAMAAGVPAVCTRVGGLPELVADGDTGLLVAPGSVPELSAALLVLARDPVRCARMGAAARERLATHFPFDGMVDQVVQELHDVRREHLAQVVR